jgi:hypothetical protein
MREDGCVMLWHPMCGTEASSSRAALPAPDGTATRPKQEQEHASVPPAHFSEAQAEQALWHEFRDHGAPLNNTLNEELQIHTGPACRALQVRVFLLDFRVFPSPLSRVFRACASSDSASPLPYPLVTGVGGPRSGEVRPPRPTELRA